jgi:hypothetical protein
VKLTRIEKSYLSELLINSIELIESSFEQNNINSLSDINRRVEEGDYEIEEIYNKLLTFKKINNKLENINEPGATLKQITSLEKTAEKRINNTKEKIVNALNLLELLNLPITVSAISKQANISFNTAKKYKKIIEEKEAHRNKQNFNNQKVS